MWTRSLRVDCTLLHLLILLARISWSAGRRRNVRARTRRNLARGPGEQLKRRCVQEGEGRGGRRASVQGSPGTGGGVWQPVTRKGKISARETRSVPSRATPVSCLQQTSLETVAYKSAPPAALEARLRHRSPVPRRHHPHHRLARPGHHGRALAAAAAPRVTDGGMGGGCQTCGGFQKVFRK